MDKSSTTSKSNNNNNNVTPTILLYNEYILNKINILANDTNIDPKILSYNDYISDNINMLDNTNNNNNQDMNCSICNSKNIYYSVPNQTGKINYCYTCVIYVRKCMLLKSRKKELINKLNIQKPNKSNKQNQKLLKCSIRSQNLKGFCKKCNSESDVCVLIPYHCSENVNISSSSDYNDGKRDLKLRTSLNSKIVKEVFTQESTGENKTDIKCDECNTRTNFTLSIMCKPQQDVFNYKNKSV